MGHEGLYNWNVGVFGGSGALFFFWILTAGWLVMPDASLLEDTR
jgi:hypothetical protein